MKSIISTIVSLVLGAAIGFFGVMAVLNTKIEIQLDEYAFPASIVLTIISGVFILVSVAMYLNIRSIASKELSGDEEDMAEGKMYRRYSDISLLMNIALVLSLVILSITLLTEQPLWIVYTAGGLLIVSLIIIQMLPGITKHMYPERNLPSVGDKDYSQKLLELSDDGERHVMLGGLYKAFLTTNVLVLGGILFLMVYSLATDNSQLVGIFLLSLIWIISNTQYIINIRNK